MADGELRFDSLVHVTADGSWLGRPAPVAALQTLTGALDEARIERACLVGIAGVTSNDTIADAYRQLPDRLVPIGSVNPAAAPQVADIVAETEALASRGFAGVKLHPRINQYDPLDERCLAAIATASRCGMVVFLDTLFRQRSMATRGAADVIDIILKAHPEAKLVLLHGAGSAILDLFELGRMHENILIDVSFTLMRYRGSSIDSDISFMCKELDQRIVAGSDFPEYSPAQAFDRLNQLTANLSSEKRHNVFSDNLTRLFAEWRGMRS